MKTIIGFVLLLVLNGINSDVKSQYVSLNTADSLAYVELCYQICPTCLQYSINYTPPQYGQLAMHNWGPSNWYDGRLTSITTNTFSLWNIIQGQLPAVIGSFPELWQLEFVKQPGLTGPIPPEIGQLPKLRWLKFDSTNVSGTIPCEIFDIPTLEYLQIGSPNITGTVPPCLCNAQRLFGLHIENTRLSGNFPDCIGSLDSLETIYFDNNKAFGGILADTVFKGNKITSVYLLNNNFHGQVPLSAESHPTLCDIWFENERFSGTFPVTCAEHILDVWMNNCEFDHLPLPVYHPVYNLIRMSYHDIRNNKFTFGDFENFYFTFGNHIDWNLIFDMIPQDSVWSPLDTTILPGSNITFESYVSGQYNAYLWYKDTTYLGWNTSGLWTINNASAADSGTYYCRIYNEYITPDRGLMLYRHHITLHVDTTVNVQSDPAFQNPQVFPVPFTSELSINLNILAGNYTAITLFNSTGIPVFTCETRKYYRIINTSDLAPGLYFLKLQQGDKVFNYKLAKE